ncbi:MAG TPA: hypothetical protein VMZ30_00485, partial [Pyrinomonadaceae bacterium]|nr:hypothetical protein [Pyrinomonadaceae bacterium]
LKTVLGLVGAAVGTEAGREVLDSVRTAVRKEPSPSSPSAAEIEALISEHRDQVNSRLESVVHELAAQNQRLEEIVRRQRLWNILLAIGVVLAIVTAFLV